MKIMWLEIKILFLGYRSDNFVVGLTNTDPRNRAPVLRQYTLCGQYPGAVPDGATVTVHCTNVYNRRLRFRYVIVQFPLIDDQMNVCEIEVFTLGRCINSMLTAYLLLAVFGAQSFNAQYFRSSTSKISKSSTLNHSFYGILRMTTKKTLNYILYFSLNNMRNIISAVWYILLWHELTLQRLQTRASSTAVGGAESCSFGRSTPGLLPS